MMAVLYIYAHRVQGKDGITAAREILAIDPTATIVFYTLLDAPHLTAQIEQLAVKKLIRKGDEHDLLQTLASMS